jgi:hypothetical protein
MNIISLKNVDSELIEIAMDKLSKMLDNANRFDEDEEDDHL